MFGVWLWNNYHEDVIKWKHFQRYWPFVRGIHQPPMNSPHKGQWRRAFMFSLIYGWLNGWVNNREAGELKRRCAHYDVIVIGSKFQCHPRHRKISLFTKYHPNDRIWCLSEMWTCHCLKIHLIRDIFSFKSANEVQWSFSKSWCNFRNNVIHTKSIMTVTRINLDNSVSLKLAGH